MWANLSSTVAKLQDGLNLEEQLVRSPALDLAGLLFTPFN